MATVNITVDSDADFYRIFQYQTLDGDPVDITGAVLWMMLRRHAKDEAAVLRVGSDTGEIVLIDPVNGKWTMLIKKEELERMETGDFDQSLIMEINGRKNSVWSGLFTINPGPSR